MPFHFDDFDPADYAEDPDTYVRPPDARRPTYQWVYEPAAGHTFEPGRDAYAALAYEGLVATGATAVRVRYDGGGDEGYAWVESVRFGDAGWTAADVVARLAAVPDLVARASCTTPPGQGYRPWGSGTELVQRLLDALAAEVATSVNGGGFGVGSSIYGAVTADLNTFRLTDDPTARPPEKD